MTGQHDLRDCASGENARQRLLAAAPVTERRLDLADVSAAVLEGGDGSAFASMEGPA